MQVSFFFGYCLRDELSMDLIEPFPEIGAWEALDSQLVMPLEACLACCSRLILWFLLVLKVKFCTGIVRFIG